MSRAENRIFHDDFSETYLVRGKEERLNHGPWRPVGWLAAEVLEYPSESVRYAGRLGILGEIRSDFASPENDAYRLLSRVGRGLEAMRGHDPEQILDSFAAHHGLLELDEQEREGYPEVPTPPAFVQSALRQLSLTHEIAESFISRPSGRRSRAARSRPWSATARVAPIDGSAAAESMFRWVGCGRDEDRFRATPAGAVFLSASYGRARGYLRVCASCGRFALLISRRFPRKRCDKCRNLNRSSDRVPGTPKVPQRHMKAWRRVQDRMYQRGRRGFKRLGILTPQERAQWRKDALQALYEVKTLDTEQLKVWEQRFAPTGRPGRPRKQHR